MPQPHFSKSIQKPRKETNIFAVWADLSPRYPDQLLGFIYADNEFEARIKAFNRGTCRYSTAFTPKVEEVDKKTRNILYSKNTHLLRDAAP